MVLIMLSSLLSPGKNNTKKQKTKYSKLNYRPSNKSKISKTNNVVKSPKKRIIAKKNDKKSYKKIRKKALNKIKIVSYALVSVLITVLILSGFSAYKFLNAPFSSAAYTDYKDTDKVWQDKQTTLMLIELEDINNKYSKINALSIIDFDNNLKRYYLYQIPVDIEVEYGLNYGKGFIYEVYAVGNKDQDRGVYLTQKTILKQFAVNIDGYVITDSQGYAKLEKHIGQINPQDLSASFRLKTYHKIPGLFNVFRDNTLTNLKLGDLKEILFFIRETSDTSSKVIKLNEDHIFDQRKWDYLWQNDHKISDVTREPVKVFVANASNPQISGLAGWGSRVVQNLGATVFDTDNSKINITENTIIASDMELLTVSRLGQTLNVKKIIAMDEIINKEDYNPEIFRADVSLLLVSY